jgi:glycosyltransferase involved in cell wall biosynthesis
MKIAMIGQKGIPSRSGGVEVHVEEIAKRLVQKGCEVDVYCRKGHCLEKGGCYQGVRTIFTPCLRSKSLEAITHSFISTLHAIFRRNDIIHYHALGPSILAFLPRLFGIRVVCTVHGLDWQRDKWGGLSKKVLKFGEYASAKFAHRTISVSEALVDYYRKKYNKEIEYIRNGVEIKKAPAPTQIKERCGLEEDSYLLYLGRLVPEKGVHYLIEAYGRTDTDKKLVIAGGSSHSDDYEKELHAMAEGNRNILFTGFVYGPILEELLRNALIYILPSDVEGMPISLLEAMSYGQCCLVSDIAENRAVVSGYGYTFKQGDPADLAAKLQMLLRQGEMVHKDRERIIEYVMENFCWDKSADRTLQLYGGLCRKHGGGII